MQNSFIINVPDSFNGFINIHNELTSYLDHFNLELPRVPVEYQEISKTYIHLDDIEINDIITNVSDPYSLIFRIVGATRGCFVLKEISRNITYENQGSAEYDIEYEIVDIHFIDSTCFDVFKMYDRKVVELAKQEFCGKYVHILLKR